jgi:hypothetical protein
MYPRSRKYSSLGGVGCFVVSDPNPGTAVLSIMSSLRSRSTNSAKVSSIAVASEDAIPSAVFVRQMPPLCFGAPHTHHPFEILTIVLGQGGIRALAIKAIAG